MTVTVVWPVHHTVSYLLHEMTETAPTRLYRAFKTQSPEGYSDPYSSFDSSAWKGWYEEHYPYDDDGLGSSVSAGATRARGLQEQDNTSLPSSSSPGDSSGNGSYPEESGSLSNSTGGDFVSSMSGADSSFNTVRNGAAVNWNNSAAVSPSANIRRSVP